MVPMIMTLSVWRSGRMPIEWSNRIIRNISSNEFSASFTEEPFPVLFPGDWFTISHGLYWEQGRTSSPLTWPFISWRNAVTTPICSALILDLPWLLSFSPPKPSTRSIRPVSPSYRECDTSFEVAMLFLSNINLLTKEWYQWYHFIVGIFTSAHCFSFLCTLPGYQKQNGGLDIEAFSPSLLVNYKSMGGGRFAIVLRLTLCVSFCCSALIPLSFLWELFLSFFLDARW